MSSCYWIEALWGDWYEELAIAKLCGWWVRWTSWLSGHACSSPSRSFEIVLLAKTIYIYIHIHISTGNLWLLRHHCFSMFSSVMAPLMFGSCSPPVFHDLTSECSPGSTATGQIGQHQKLTRMQRTGDGQNVYIWYICCCFNQYKQRRWRWRDPKMPVRVLAILSKDPKMPAPEEWFGRCIRSKIARVAQQLVGSAEFCLTKPTQYNN